MFNSGHGGHFKTKTLQRISQSFVVSQRTFFITAQSANRLNERCLDIERNSSTLTVVVQKGRPL
jgi:hypothetical protein